VPGVIQLLPVPVPVPGYGFSTGTGMGFSATRGLPVGIQTCSQVRHCKEGSGPLCHVEIAFQQGKKAAPSCHVEIVCRHWQGGGGPLCHIESGVGRLGWVGSVGKEGGGPLRHVEIWAGGRGFCLYVVQKEN